MTAGPTEGRPEEHRKQKVMRKHAVLAVIILLSACAGAAAAQNAPARGDNKPAISREELEQREKRILELGDDLKPELRPGAYAMLAVTYMQYDEPGKAITWGEKYMEINESDPVLRRRADIHLMLVQIYCKMDMKIALEKALKYLEALKKMVDEHPAELPNLAKTMNEQNYAVLRGSIVLKLEELKNK